MGGRSATSGSVTASPSRCQHLIKGADLSPPGLAPRVLLIEWIRTVHLPASLAVSTLLAPAQRVAAGALQMCQTLERTTSSSHACYCAASH